MQMMKTSFGGEENRMKTTQSEHYWQGHFHNEHEVKVMTGAGFSSSMRKRPKSRIAVRKPELLPEPQGNDLSFTWLGHSSFFIQLGKVNILVDPVLSERCSPVRFAGPKRFSDLPWTADELPRIDVLFLSHDHYDHMDYATIRAVKEKAGAVVAPLGVDKILESWGVLPEKIHALDWWERFSWKDASFTLTPSQHFSGRNPFRRNSTLWGGVYIENSFHRLYYTGDGGYSASFGKIRERLGEPELIIAECGQYDPAWANIHMFPEQTVQAGVDLKAECLIPVHWGSFCICNHAWDDSIRRVTAAAKTAGLRIATPRIGQTVKYESISSCNEQWWEAYE